MIVVDASVFNKLFLDEPDRDQAQRLFGSAIENNIPIIAPGLLLYESLAVALHYGVEPAIVLSLLDPLRDAGMRLVEPSGTDIERAFEIAQAAGRPSLQDSLYHALAIETGGTFVTADRRHLKKTSRFGHIVLLSDYGARTGAP